MSHWAALLVFRGGGVIVCYLLAKRIYYRAKKWSKGG